MSIFLNPNGLNSAGGSGGGGTTDVPNASTGQAGKVRLSNAIDSDSQNMASTPLAVKTALTEAKNYTNNAIAKLNIQDIISNLNDHESSLINTEQGLHGVRIWQGKLQQTNNNGATWIDVASNVNIVDNLNSTDTTSALSANQGNVIKLLIEKLQLDLTNHETKIANETEYGHVKIDNNTLKYNVNGQLYADINVDADVDWNDVQNKPTSIVTDIDDAVAKKHEHANQSVLDKFSEDLNGKPLYNGLAIGSGNGSVALVNGDLTQKGIVQLSDVIADDSTLSATPKSVFNALAEAKEYADTLIDNLESTLEKHSFELRPATQGQLEFDMPDIYNQNPQHYIESLYFNATKVLESKYSIVEKVKGDKTQGFKLVLVSPAPDFNNAIYNLVLVGGKALSTGGGGNGTVTSVNGVSPDTTGDVKLSIPTVQDGNLTQKGIVQLSNDIIEDESLSATSKAVFNALSDAKEYADKLIDDLESTLVKHSFDLRPTTQGQLEFDMPAIYNQNPDLFINLLYFNSIKVAESQYSIVEKVNGDASQGFKIVLTSPAPNFNNAIYDLVLIGGKALATGGTGNGTVISINNISPDATGNVQIPQATSTVQGVTYLTDVVDNTDNKAVTPKAVKDYVDALNNFVYTSDAPPTNNSLFWNKV